MNTVCNMCVRWSEHCLRSVCEAPVGLAHLSGHGNAVLAVGGGGEGWNVDTGWGDQVLVAMSVC